MASGPNAALGKDRPCARRRWPYALGVAVVLLSVAYASLPFWLPAGWLARRIERQLAAELERPVTIGRLHIDWAKGFVIEDLAIGDLPDAPNPHLARIGRLRCDFTPVLTLATGRVDQLEIDGLQMWVVQNDEGHLNIERLPDGQLPTLSYRVDDAICHVWTPRARQMFRIDALHCRIEPERALLDLNGCATVAAGQRFGFDARLTVPRLRKDLDLSLSGTARVEWADLSLTDLPLSLISALPVEQVGGTTSGMLSFETRPDLSVDFRQWIEVRGVRLMWAGLDRPALVPDAVLRCEGRWEPQNDRLIVGKLEYESQAVELKGADHPAVQMDPRGDLLLESALVGRIKSWELLRREVPRIDDLAELLGVELAGQERFELRASRRGDRGHFELVLDEGSSRWTLARGAEEMFAAGEEVAKKLEVVASGDFASRRVESSVRLRLGDLQVSLTGEGIIPGGRASCPPQVLEEGGQDVRAPRSSGGQDARPPTNSGGHLARPPMAASPPARWWEGLAASLELRTRRIEQVVAMFPAAKRRPEFASWRGPLEATVQVVPAAGGSRVNLGFHVDAAAALGWWPWFDKPAGRPLSITAGATVPHEASGRVDDLHLAARYGEGRILVEPGQAWARYGFEKGGDFDLNVVLPARGESVECLAALCPRWAEWTSGGGRQLSGAVSVSTRVDVSGRPGESSFRFSADIDADRLAARWDDALLKPAGEPLAVRLAGHSRTAGEARDDGLRMTLRLPGGELEAAMAADAGGESPGCGFEQCTLETRVHDLEKLLGSFPGLAERLRAYRPGGSFEARVEAVVSDERCAVDLSVQADRAEFTLPGESPGTKPAGVPAEARLRWEGEPGETGGGAWRLVSGQARLAGLTVSEMTGQVVAEGPPPVADLGGAVEGEGAAVECVGPSGSWWGPGRLWGLRPAVESLGRISAAHVQLKGTAVCAPALDELSPSLARLRERLGLSGSVKWETEASGNDEAFRFAARLDASDLAWSVPTDLVPFPVHQFLGGSGGQDARPPKNAGGQDARSPEEPAGLAGGRVSCPPHGPKRETPGPERALVAVPAVHKPARVPAALAVELAAVPGPDGPARRVDARLEVDVDGNRLRADGQAVVTGRGGDAAHVGDLDCLVRLSLDNPRTLPQLTPGSPIERMDGAGTIELGLERRGETTRLTGVHAEFQNLVVASGGSTLTLDGRGTWEPGGARIPGLEWQWGESGGKIDGQVNFLPGGVQGRVGLATSRLDVSDLQRQFAAWVGGLAPPPATAPGDRPEDDNRLLRSALAFLARSDLKVDGQVGELEVVLPPGIPVRGQTVVHSLQAGRGPVSFTFAGTVEGGAVQGRVETIADAADPRMRLTYTAERIQPGPLVDAYLRQSFPGMTATGPLTLIDESNQKLLPAPGELNWPTGTGELIIHGGRVVGRAAPRAIARIFPGLNLASFDFSYMHSWFRKEVTGRIHHQMIYQGRYYNIYMNGYSEPAGFRYEVGIDFLADFDSKYWAETGQGRVPLFTKTGRIRPDGSIENEEVAYMPQRFFDTVLVKNNPVFTAYHAVRKRVRREK